MEIKAGDYLITEEKQLFRIVDIHVDTKGIYYDIKNFNDAGLLRSIPRNVLKHMGKIIPEEKATKSIKILYG